MTADSITSFVVRCQHVSSDDDKLLKVKLTHVQTNEDSYFERLEDAFQKMKEVVANNETKKG